MPDTKKSLHMCFDRRLTPEEEAIAQLEIEKEQPAPDRGPMRIAVEKWKLWTPGSVLRVGFLEGDADVKDRVFAKAKEWEEVVSIRFERVAAPETAHIRISFDTSDGSWSYVGRECLGIPKGRPTMNYGWLFPDTSAEEYSRVVLHEFGHALGCIHEHQNPTAGIQWNEEAVYRYYGGHPNYWSRADTYSNILEKYRKDQTNSTKFDRDSIMIYAIPKELLAEGEGFPENSRLSPTDIAFMKSIYP